MCTIRQRLRKRRNLLKRTREVFKKRRKEESDENVVCSFLFDMRNRKERRRTDPSNRCVRQAQRFFIHITRKWPDAVEQTLKCDLTKFKKSVACGELFFKKYALPNTL